MRTWLYRIATNRCLNALRDGGRRPDRTAGQPAVPFGCYLRDPRTPGLHPHGVLVLTLTGDRIGAVTRFLDNSLLAAFGLPRSLRDWTVRDGR